MKRAWKYLVIAAFYVFALASGCDESGEGEKKPSPCPNYFGPQACYTDQDCIDLYEGDNWICDITETVGSNGCQAILSKCVPDSEEPVASEHDAQVPLDDDAGGE